jgi:excisionase family DNA binding protein|tara:strand:- start:7155 stop:7391 length:237 start_codon:yes stop_codon:yes gene_type:complete
MQQYMTIKEVAELLRVSDQTVRNYIKNKSLKSVKFGSSHRAPVRIHIDDLNEFIGVSIAETDNVYKDDSTDSSVGEEE